MRILVTGAAGYLGRLVTASLAQAALGQDALEQEGPELVVASDLRELSEQAGVLNARLDIRDVEGVAELVGAHGIDRVVHLAAMVSPGPDDSRQLQYEVDVEGTANLLAACRSHGVEKLVYTSSGAAYGYQADNPPLLTEADALRADESFAYAWHKRLVEELLADARADSPDLKQLIFRVSTVLGPSVDNQITALFDRPVVVGVKGADTPFCFASDHDVVQCIVAGVLGEQAGIYNLTGHGVMTLREIAAALGHRYLPLPEPLLQRVLGVLQQRGWTRYGPEQTRFLQHRPVLSNQRLCQELGYTPQSSRAVFEAWRAGRG